MCTPGFVAQWGAALPVALGGENGPHSGMSTSWRQPQGKFRGSGGVPVPVPVSGLGRGLRPWGAVLSALSVMICALLVSLQADPVQAHALASSKGEWAVVLKQSPTLPGASSQAVAATVKGEVTVDVTAAKAVGGVSFPKSTDAAAAAAQVAVESWLKAHGPNVAAKLREETTATFEGKPCTPSPSPSPTVAEDRETLTFHLAFECPVVPGKPGQRLGVSLYLGFVPKIADDHQHMARIGAQRTMATAEDPEVVVWLWVPQKRAVRAETSDSPMPLPGVAPEVLVPQLQSALGFKDFVAEGLRHIAGGWDHILFVLALLLTVASLRQALWVVTAFTFAHSLTLMLAVMGWVSFPANFVEVGIAASIVWVAVSAGVRSGRSKEGTSRTWVWALGFGLIHGLGFASYLRGLDFFAGGIWSPLLGFNLGVEAGQLAIVVLVLPLMMLAARRVWWPVAHKTMAGLIALAGSYWLVERLL